MKIEGVVISCYRSDLRLTRICVASVRFWYPDVPIWLLKDRHYGDFDTGEIEKYWNAQVYPTRQKTQGWGFGKLEVMTELPKRQLLFSTLTLFSPEGQSIVWKSLTRTLSSPRKTTTTQPGRRG